MQAPFVWVRMDETLGLDTNSSVCGSGGTYSGASFGLVVSADERM